MNSTRKLWEFVSAKSDTGLSTGGEEASARIGFGGFERPEESDSREYLMSAAQKHGIRASWRSVDGSFFLYLAAKNRDAIEDFAHEIFGGDPGDAIEWL